MMMIVGKTLSHSMVISMQSSLIYVHYHDSASHNIESMTESVTAGAMQMKMLLLATKIYVLEFENIGFNVQLSNQHVSLHRPWEIASEYAQIIMMNIYMDLVVLFPNLTL